MKAEWVNALAALAAVVVALYGVLVAGKQLGGLRETLRADSLMAVLAIESELAGRSETCSEVSMLIARLDAQKSFDAAEMQALKSRLESAVESWLNALERLCFCINKSYVPEKDWRAEYREYVVKAIRSHPDFFKAGSRHTNTLALNERWQAD